MYITTTSSESASTLKELIRLRAKASIEKSTERQNFLHRQPTEGKAIATKIQQQHLKNHAPPLNALREQDLQALAEMFDRQNSDEIEADIAEHLHLLCPEPCWEEDTLDFLQDYLR